MVGRRWRASGVGEELFSTRAPVPSLGTASSDAPLVRWQLPAAILAVTFFTYVDTLALGFVFDDHILILSNDAIRSWRYLPSYFASHIWSFTYPHLLANYYRPLFMIWLRLNDMLFGLHPAGWHLTSVLAHVAVTYLVYRFCLRLTRDGWVAGAAGPIFGLHPVHVEAVADITSIQEPLSTFFILAAMLAFCRSREPGPRRRWLAASLALTTAALLSKESGLILPVLVSGFVWTWGESRGREVAPVENRTHRLLGRLRSALGAAIPYWAVILVYVPLRIWALKGFAHVITPLALSKEVLTLPSVLVFYLRLLVWPFGLSCYYDTPYISTPSWQQFVLPAMLLAALAAGLVLWYGRTRQSAPEEAKAMAFACLWMALTLVPVLNFRFLPVGEIAHDRYVYLPSVGFVILVAIALRQALSGRLSFFRKPAWALSGALVVSGAMGYATARQSLFWSDDLTLNYRAHEIAPHNVYATTSFAAAVAQHGMEGAAVALYQQALAIQPDFWRANLNLANLYYAHGDFPKAAQYFSRACTVNPTDGDQFLYLGMALLQMGQLTEAEKAVRTALLVRPQGKNYHLGLAMVLRLEGRLAEAREEIAAELAKDAGNLQALTLLDEIVRQTPAPDGESSGGKPQTGPSSALK